MTHARGALTQGLLQAVRAQDFASTPDAWRDGAPVAAFPSIDLAVVDFTRAGSPRRAKVLFSRQHPPGLVAGIGGGPGAARDERRHYIVAVLAGLGRRHAPHGRCATT